MTKAVKSDEAAMASFPRRAEDIVPTIPTPDVPLAECLQKGGLLRGQQTALLAMRFHHGASEWVVEQRYEKLAQSVRNRLGWNLLCVFAGESRGPLPIGEESRGGVETTVYETVAMGYRPVAPERVEPLDDDERQVVIEGYEAVAKLMRGACRAPYDRIIDKVLGRLGIELRQPILFAHDPSVVLSIHVLGFCRLADRYELAVKALVDGLRFEAEMKQREREERKAREEAMARLEAERRAWGLS